MKSFKKSIGVLLVIVVMIGLSACNHESVKNESSAKLSPENASTEGKLPINMVSFEATIDSIEKNQAIVTIVKSDDDSLKGSKVIIDTKDYSKKLNVKDTITVYYDGVVMESDPLQVRVMGINDEIFIKA